MLTGIYGPPGPFYSFLTRLDYSGGISTARRDFLKYGTLPTKDIQSYFSTVGLTGDLSANRRDFFSELKRTFVSFSGGSCEIDTVWESNEEGNYIEVVFQAPTSTLSTAQYILDGDGPKDRLYLRLAARSGKVNTSEVLGLYLDGVPVELGSKYPTDGQLHTYRMILPQEPCRVKYIGTDYLGTESYEGILANVKFIDKKDPSNSRYYAINKIDDDTEFSLLNTGTLTYRDMPVDNRKIYNYDPELSTWTSKDLPPIFKH